MAAPLTAIPTEYNGIQMRSRFEANVALVFDQLGLRWQYEPKSFLFKEAGHYRPDFYLPDHRTWVEVRGYGDPYADMALWYMAIEGNEENSLTRMILVSSIATDAHPPGVYVYTARPQPFCKDDPWEVASICWCRKCGEPSFRHILDETCIACHYNDGAYGVMDIYLPVVEDNNVLFASYSPYDPVVSAHELMSAKREVGSAAEV